MSRVTYVVKTQADTDWRSGIVCIDGVIGNFCHAAECIIARPVQAPPLPLHPDVRTQAENLLSLGVPTSDILVRNQQLLESLGGFCATAEYRIFLEHQVCCTFDLCSANLTSLSFGDRPASHTRYLLCRIW